VDYYSQVSILLIHVRQQNGYYNSVHVLNMDMQKPN